ncbi:MAG: DUF4492 domain-containing protein [Sphingobacteriia bacterium]|nr:DUF4492 domain-containing protein [Sphingobacteriia bacterium]
MSKNGNLFLRVFHFYLDGFRGMPKWGRQLWVIILLKLFLMFAVFRIFFFPDFLKSNFDNDSERSRHVIEQLTEPNN